MLKKIIFITYLFHCTAVHAQQENNTHARIIKITAADSLVTLSKPLKTRLQKAAADKKNNTLRLLITGSNAAGSNNVCRWVAAKKQQDVYRINLAALVNKYIGETEKNLEQLFTKAAEKNWVLFFDEADALFGKRGNTGTSTAGEAFIRYCNAFKGTILIRCTGNDCLRSLEKNYFIVLSSDEE